MTSTLASCSVLPDGRIYVKFEYTSDKFLSVDAFLQSVRGVYASMVEGRVCVDAEPPAAAEVSLIGDEPLFRVILRG